MKNLHHKNHSENHSSEKTSQTNQLASGKRESNYSWKNLISNIFAWIGLALILLTMFYQLRSLEGAYFESSTNSHIPLTQFQPCSELPAHGSAYMMDPSIMQRTDSLYSGLEIRNDYNHPMVAMLLDVSAKKQLLALSIHSGNTMQLSVPIGKYGMQVLIGSKWCNLVAGFTDGAAVSVADGISVQTGSTTSLHFSGSGLHPIQLALAYSQSKPKHTQTIEQPSEVTGLGELELKQTHDGHYLTSGSVNGTPVVFMIDTGATALSISSEIASRAGIRNCTPLQVVTANGQVNACITKVPEVTFGSFKLTHVDVAIMPNMPGESLLGMNVLRNFRIEQVNRTMRISTP